MTIHQRLLITVVGVTATVVLSACSGTSTASPAPAPTTASAQATGKVSANSASIPELQTAFEAAGVSNAARWAREVDEYRPYETSDTSFSKLRRELAKYNPSQDTVEKIVSTLALQ